MLYFSTVPLLEVKGISDVKYPYCLVFATLREDDVLNDLESLKDGEPDKENATSESKVRTCIRLFNPE